MSTFAMNFHTNGGDEVPEVAARIESVERTHWASVDIGPITVTVFFDKRGDAKAWLDGLHSKLLAALIAPAPEGVDDTTVSPPRVREFASFADDEIPF